MGSGDESWGEGIGTRCMIHLCENVVMQPVICLLTERIKDAGHAGRRLHAAHVLAILSLPSRYCALDFLLPSSRDPVILLVCHLNFVALWVSDLKSMCAPTTWLSVSSLQEVISPSDMSSVLVFCQVLILSQGLFVPVIKVNRNLDSSLFSN